MDFNISEIMFLMEPLRVITNFTANSGSKWGRADGDGGGGGDGDDGDGGDGDGGGGGDGDGDGVCNYWSTGRDR